MSGLGFGRIEPPAEYWPAIAAKIACAPEPADEGPTPVVSLPLWRWRHPRYHAQLAGRGCCVGESIADMLELNARRPNDAPAPPPLVITPGVPAISPLWIYWIARQYSAKQGRPLWGQDGAIVSDALLAVMESGVIPWDAWPGTEANYRNYTDKAPPRSALDAPRIKVSGECLRITSVAQLAQYVCGKGLAVVAGTAWRGGMTAPRGQFNWGASSVGGHAYTISGLDIPADKLTADNSWDNAGWGVQPAEGAVDQQGNILPRGYASTSWRVWAAWEMAAAALSSGATEIIVIEGVQLGDPTPLPDPTPPPSPPTPPTPPTPPGPPTPPIRSGKWIAEDGSIWAVTAKRLA